MSFVIDQSGKSGLGFTTLENRSKNFCITFEITLVMIRLFIKQNIENALGNKIIRAIFSGRKIKV